MSLVLAQGYKLVDPPTVGKLTRAQFLFIAFTQIDFYQTMLSPYIDQEKLHKPSPEMLARERAQMAELSKKFEGKNFYDVPIPRDWDPSTPLYD